MTVVNRELSQSQNCSLSCFVCVSIASQVAHVYCGVKLVPVL
jgi:hypothetical protein